jgi:hypothetical protein
MVACSIEKCDSSYPATYDRGQCECGTGQCVWIDGPVSPLPLTLHAPHSNGLPTAASFSAAPIAESVGGWGVDGGGGGGRWWRGGWRARQKRSAAAATATATTPAASPSSTAPPPRLAPPALLPLCPLCGVAMARRSCRAQEGLRRCRGRCVISRSVSACPACFARTAAECLRACQLDIDCIGVTWDAPPAVDAEDAEDNRAGRCYKVQESCDLVWPLLPPPSSLLSSFGSAASLWWMCGRRRR